MQTYYIKYMITTKRALKTDTFKKFIEQLFTEFPEKQAKRLTNSFIEGLGTKYSKVNQGLLALIMKQRCVVGSLNKTSIRLVPNTKNQWVYGYMGHIN